MNDLILLAGLYGFCGAFFVLVRKLSIRRKAFSDNKVTLQSGIEAEIDTELSNNYFEAIGFLLLGTGFLFGICSEFTAFSNPYLSLIVNLPIIVLAYLFGFTTFVVRFRSTSVEVKADMKTLAIVLAMFLWPLVSYIVAASQFGVLGVPDYVYRDAVAGLPFVVGFFSMLIVSWDSFIFGGGSPPFGGPRNLILVLANTTYALWLPFIHDYLSTKIIVTTVSIIGIALILIYAPSEEDYAIG